MRIGTTKGVLSTCGISEAEEYSILAKLGFDSIDYPVSNNYRDPLWKLSDEALRQKMESIRDVIHSCGLIVGQTHSPIEADWLSSPETKEIRWHSQVQAIKATAFLGAPYTVIHPICPPGRANTAEYYEYAKEINMEYYRYLEPYLREYNVKGAIENLFVNDSVLGRTIRTACSSAEDLIDYIDTLDSDRIVACLDVGHAVLAGEDPVRMIYKLGKKYLHVTHIHDNDYINDDHFMPGIGKIDWCAVGKALNDIGYEGIFSYEANRTFRRIGPSAKEVAIEFLEDYVLLAKAITNIK